MDFDFEEVYQSYSTIELLKIIAQPEQYQPSAIKAANKILSGRDIKESDIAEKNSYLESININKRTKYTADAIDEESELFDPVIQAHVKLRKPKWFIAFLVAVGLIFLFALYQGISFVAFYTKLFIDCQRDGLYSSGECLSYTIFSTINLVYTAVIFFTLITFYLLFKRKKWGWILIFSVFFLSLLLSIKSLVLSSAADNWTQSPNTLIIRSIVALIFVFFLWKKKTSDFFDVSVKAKTNSISTVFFLSLGIMVYSMID